MNNVFDFSKYRPLRVARETGITSLNATVHNAVAHIVRPDKYRLHIDRLRKTLDDGAENFFVSLVRMGCVTIVNFGDQVDFSSILRIDDASGNSSTFPVDNFVRLVAPNPSQVTSELLEVFLLEALQAFSVRIGMSYEEEETTSFEELTLEQSSIFQFRPEVLPVIMVDQNSCEQSYSCFFSESSYFLASITPEYFQNPLDVSVLELMCLARIDYVDEGNELQRDGYMELERADDTRVHITRIPLQLVDAVIASAISRKSKILDHLKPEDRIIQYAISHVYPRVNPELYHDE